MMTRPSSLPLAATIAILGVACSTPQPEQPAPATASSTPSPVPTDPVRWVYHPDVRPAVVSPSLKLPGDQCLIATPVGRWLVRPSPSGTPSPYPFPVPSEITVCAGTAEFIPGAVPGAVLRAAARGDDLIYLATSGLYRSRTPRGVIERDEVPESLIDVAAAGDRFAAVGRSGHVYVRGRGTWQKLDAPTDAVELTSMGDELVALSVPERYTVIEAGGRARSPSPDVNPRAALRSAVPVWPALVRDEAQRRPSLFEEGPDASSDWPAPGGNLPPDCHPVAQEGRRKALLCRSSAKARLHLSVDGGATLAPKSVAIDAPASGWYGDATLSGESMTVVQPEPSCAGTLPCAEQLVVADTANDGFTALERYPWKGAAPLLVWRPQPGAPRMVLRLVSGRQARAEAELHVDAWRDGAWLTVTKHPLPRRTEKTGTPPRHDATAHRDESGRIRVLENVDVWIQGKGNTNDWSYITLSASGQLSSVHLLPRAVAASAWADHVVLWPFLGPTFVESANAGATTTVRKEEGLRTIMRPEEVKVACGPRGCTFGDQVTRLGWLADETQPGPPIPMPSAPDPREEAPKADRWDACEKDGPVVLRCAATEASPPKKIAQPRPNRTVDGRDFRLPASHRAVIGGRDALVRIDSDSGDAVELIDDEARSRTVTVRGCGRATSVERSKEGLACFLAAKGRATVAWYAAKTGKIGSWSIPAPKIHDGPGEPAWDGHLSPDGLAVWSGCCRSSEVWAGPWGGPPSLFKASGVSAWTPEGLVSWSTGSEGGVASRKLLRVEARDPRGHSLWKLQTLAGEGTRGASDLGAAFEVRVEAHGTALRARTFGLGDGWETLSPLSAGKVGASRRIAPASLVKPLPSCSANRRRDDPFADERDADDKAARVEVRDPEGNVRIFRTTSAHIFGLTESCAAAWELEACDSQLHDELVALDGTRRSGVLIREQAGVERRYSLACAP